MQVLFIALPPAATGPAGRTSRKRLAIETICSTGSRPGSEHDLTELGRPRPDSQDPVATTLSQFLGAEKPVLAATKSYQPLSNYLITRRSQ
jgi:hypothetical protein